MGIFIKSLNNKKQQTMSKNNTTKEKLNELAQTAKKAFGRNAKINEETETITIKTFSISKAEMIIMIAICERHKAKIMMFGGAISNTIEIIFTL